MDAAEAVVTGDFAAGARRVEVGYNTAAGLSIHSANELIAYLIVVVVPPAIPSAGWHPS